MPDITLHLDSVSMASSAVIKNLQWLILNYLDPRIAIFHMRNIAKIRKMLSVHNAERLVHSFVTSRLDYCNALLSGCANASLKTLQLVQNAEARIHNWNETL